MAIKDALLADYDHEMGTTRRLLERVPDDKLAWKPHEKSMTLGELATHVSRIPSWGGTILNDPFFDLAEAPAAGAGLTSRAAILASFDDTRARTRAWMDKIDGEYNALWTLKRGSQQVFSVPRVSAFRNFVLHHIIHHRGQLSVYLRLNDVAVPAIYGPSADEGS
ncbi:MAG: DinB family protein [Vicinamibacterales bacterium]